MALPSLKTRRRQLKAGWWGRMCNTEHHRLLSQVFRHRHAEVDVGLAPRSHLQSVKHTLGALGLSLSWQNRSADLDGWKGRVAWHAQEIERDEFKVAAAEQHSLDTYVALGLAPMEFVPRYLSDCSNREGTRLLTACRMGSLQLMGRIARFMNWPAIGGSCLLCSSGETENVEHFVLRCAALQKARSRCDEGLHLALPLLGIPGATLWARYQTPEGRFGLLLGNSPKVLKEQQVDTAVHAEDWARACWVMDKAAKNLLVAMWRMRDAIMGKVSV